MEYREMPKTDRKCERQGGREGEREREHWKTNGKLIRSKRYVVKPPCPLWEGYCSYFWPWAHSLRERVEARFLRHRGRRHWAAIHALPSPIFLLC